LDRGQVGDKGYLGVFCIFDYLLINWMDNPTIYINSSLIQVKLKLSNFS
jgi:hypothetical protein